MKHDAAVFVTSAVVTFAAVAFVLLLGWAALQHFAWSRRQSRRGRRY